MRSKLVKYMMDHAITTRNGNASRYYGTLEKSQPPKSANARRVIAQFPEITIFARQAQEKSTCSLLITMYQRLLC